MTEEEKIFAGKMFDPRKKELKDWQGAIWIHAVSVGETNLALTLLKEWNAVNPDRKYIFSTSASPLGLTVI